MCALPDSAEYHLRRALLTAGHPHDQPPTTALPGFGDAVLAAAVAGPACTTASEGAAAVAATAQLFESLAGGADDSSNLPYAQLQRVLCVECYCHCLGALLPAAADGPSRLRLLNEPLGKLLERVGRRCALWADDLLHLGTRCRLHATTATTPCPDTPGVRHSDAKLPRNNICPFVISVGTATGPRGAGGGAVPPGLCRRRAGRGGAAGGGA